MKKIHILPLNRVEGDLKIHLELDNNIVTQARSSGVMYRGFENIMIGRGPLDGLVITPRICGICSTAHLKAAAKALDMVCKVNIPDNAKRVRNITLMTEMLQNDVRQAFLLFMCDFANPYYKNHSLFEEAVRRYEPLKGETAIQTIQESKKIIEIIAIFGGQWTHSSFMVPGGVVSVPGAGDITKCLYLLRHFRTWYEKRVLGCSLERWQDVKSKADLDLWLDESDSHKNSDLGFFIRFAKEAGLDKLGKGHENFICFGSFDMPEHTGVSSLNETGLSSDNRQFFPGGFSKGTETETFNHEKVTEDITHSWFSNSEAASHPFDGVTKPYATGWDGEKYSWAKAPRYNGLPAETGPLAEMIMAQHPLFVDLITKEGPDLFVRELARIVRPALLMPVVKIWLKEIAPGDDNKDGFFRNYGKIESGQGFGLTEASRGALGHWIKIKEGKIEKYQVITPTTWNASPCDCNGVRGPWEEALINTEIRDIENPIEAGLIVRSFDPCLVCSVHAIKVSG